MDIPSVDDVRTTMLYALNETYIFGINDLDDPPPFGFVTTVSVSFDGDDDGDVPTPSPSYDYDMTESPVPKSRRQHNKTPL